MDEIVATITCRRCKQDGVVAHASEPNMCEACVKAENNRVSFYWRHNADWLEIAKEADLQLWERQPAETDHEYHIWMCYRDAYPGKRPSYRDVADQLATTVNAVKKVGMRWDFPVRMQAWIKHVDEITMERRRQQIVDMNERHVSMAQKMAEKLERAINQIDPDSLSPREISSLLKVSSELERKARLTDVPDVTVGADDGNPDLKKDVTKSENIGEIVEILQKAGLLGVGVRQTVTTEVVMKKDD